MAAIDDLVYLASAIRVDVRNALDNIERKLDGGGSPGSPKPPAGSDPGFGSGLTRGVSSLVNIFGSVERAVVSFGNQLTKFVGQANPAAVIRFQIAVADLQAVIGRALLPVMNQVTAVVRYLADAFASLSPKTQQFVAALAGGAGLGAVFGGLAAAASALIKVLGPWPAIFGAVAGVLAGMLTQTERGRELFRAMGSVLSSLAGVIEGVLVPVLRFVTPLVELLAIGLAQLADVIHGILDFIGLAEDVKPNASVGAAVRRANIGSIESFQQRNVQSAYSGGISDIPRESLGELKGIRSGIDKLPDRLAERMRDRTTPGRGTPGDAGRRWIGSAAAGAAIGSFVPGVGTALGGAVGGLVGIMRELFS